MIDALEEDIEYCLDRLKSALGHLEVKFPIIIESSLVSDQSVRSKVVTLVSFSQDITKFCPYLVPCAPSPSVFSTITSALDQCPDIDVIIFN